jgi:hypothetical protein
MSLRATLTRLFRTLTFTRRPAAALSTADLAREDIARRVRVRTTLPISNACRVNGLNNRERARVFEAFESLSPEVGMSEARNHACNLAASIASHRRTRLQRPSDPWEPTPPAAA